MGTKGRNLLIWIFLFTAPLSIAGGGKGLPAFFFYVNITAGVAVLYYNIYDYRWRKKSLRSGLKCVVLLPVNHLWARILIKTSGKKLKYKGKKAYEIHIRANEEHSLGSFLKMVEKDLKTIKKNYPKTLLIWETNAPVPSSIRRYIRELESVGLAFWEKKKWPVPRPPFVEKNLKGKHNVRRGAIIIPGEQEVL